ncbi:hypothetical protein B0H16DRAFT_1375768 [Mycena metata]|uniref:Aminoglycoside phosphotransferase domain-containing protein n=1 Tax=Mycena metata TaxID=1033252 RepID=A0AAD7IMF8_9AGAR|nr:hypothetical protein B0H16DRAFT_1375768 [Mycena metata]
MAIGRWKRAVRALFPPTMIDSDLERLGPKSKDSISSDDDRFWRDNLPPCDESQLIETQVEPPLFQFSVEDLVKEVQIKLQSVVTETIYIGSGANHFGLGMRLADDRALVVRISRYDVNSQRLYRPTRDDAGVSRLERMVGAVEFEVAIYNTLRSDAEVKVSRLLFHRVPVRVTPNERHNHLMGRELFVFEKADGKHNVWPDNEDRNLKILTQCAHMRAALFNFCIPWDFAKSWLPQNSPNPKVFPTEIVPTREFAISFLSAKVEEMIKNEGDMIGWESDHNVVGPIAAKAKQSLLRVIPVILPVEGDQNAFYRFVLEHDDFGIHNMTINDKQDVTSLFDWETSHIVPAILSDPRLTVWCDLAVDEEGNPIISRLWEDMDNERRSEFQGYAKHYWQILSERAPEFISTVSAAKDARHVWFTLKAWRGNNPEGYFGDLGTWADRRYKELKGVSRT